MDRLIFRSDNLSVAQTVGVRPDGSEYVRETEVIVRREADPNVSFYIYGPEGTLSRKSEFINGVMADGPYVCMSCHYSKKRRLFTASTFDP